MWTANHDAFLESMVDASKSIMDYYKDQIVFINVMCNMSVDCDCCAVAEDPEKADLIERIESRNGVHTIEAAEQLGVGSRAYELISI